MAEAISFMKYTWLMTSIHTQLMVNFCMQLDSKTVEELDSNLKEGSELAVLYNELLKTISKDYMNIDSVSSSVCAPNYMHTVCYTTVQSWHHQLISGGHSRLAMQYWI